MRIRDLAAHGAAEELAEALAAAAPAGELYPPQRMAVEAGLLAGRDSFVVAAPTASGKTMIAEMAALQEILEARRKVVYLVPLRALAREKYEDFARRYGGLGVRMAQSSGDLDSAAPWLAAADWIVATNEKIDSLIRHRAAWIRDVGLVVADEVHLLGDPHRGPTLEIVLTRLRRLIPEIRVVALSATIPNAAEIAGWLDARLIMSDWRPVPLREGVFCHETVMFHDGTVTRIPATEKDEAVNLALQTLHQGGQALVFVNTRRSAEGLARRAAAAVARLVPEEEKAGLEKLAREVLTASPEPTRLCRRLAECVRQGAAFHHAGISAAQRRLVEDAFRGNRLRLIVATTTLAMGLNLPSRRVVIRDWWRYEAGLGMQPLPVLEVKQMAGRAGRPGLDEYGEAVLLARNRRDEHFLFASYVGGVPEKTASQLGSESALRSHILAAAAGGFARSRQELGDFLSRTFYAHQHGRDVLESLAGEILDFLLREGMVVGRKKGLTATGFGRRAAELYIDPLSAVLLREALHRPGEKAPFPLLQLVAATPNMRLLALRRKDVEEAMRLFVQHRAALLLPEEEKVPAERLLAELKTAALLSEWIEEAAEDRIVGRFDVGPGDLHALVDLAEWLLYAAAEIARIFNLEQAERSLALLRTRVAYGIREELLPLVALRGIGRVRARGLFRAGYTDLKSLAAAPVKELAKVPKVGRAVAEAIKRQVAAARG